MDQQGYYRLISGEEKGWVASFLYFLLLIVSQIYRIIVVSRNFLYSKGTLKQHKVGAAVVSIGNVTAGGTGKTPVVIWVCNLLEKRKIGCAILTRGYKTNAETLEDEPAILAKSCPQAEVIVNPDRLIAARKAIDRYDAKAIVLDDGFQHRRLSRDLDIVTIDATRPFGCGKVLPAGFLREPLNSLGRAGAVIITRCDQVDAVELTKIEEKLLSINGRLIIAKAVHAPVGVTMADGKTLDIEELKNKKIFAFCGIGNPESFFKSIVGLGADLVGSKIYNDHYKYGNDDVGWICQQADALNADMVLCTQKDWTKLNASSLAVKGSFFGYLAIELRFIGGEEKITQLIDEVLAGKIHGE